MNYAALNKAVLHLFATKSDEWSNKENENYLYKANLEHLELILHEFIKYNMAAQT